MSIPWLDTKNRLLRFAAIGLTGLPGGHRSPSPRSILVTRHGNLGDCVVALPVFHALRRLFPESRLTLLTSPMKRGALGAREILSNDRTFDEIIVYYDDEASDPAFLERLRAGLRIRRIDLAIFLTDHSTSFSWLLSQIRLLAAAGVRHFEGLTLVGSGGRPIRQVERLAQVLAPWGQTEIPAPPWLTVGRADTARAKHLLSGIPRPIVALHSGAARPANRWLPERFSELARRLLIERKVSVVLTGSPEERELSETIRADAGEGCFNLAGETTVSELAAVLQQVAVLVSNDTGAMHIGYAVGTPVLALFGGRFFPQVWMPYGEGHISIYKNVECSPCGKDVCPRFSVPECMRLIQVDEVLKATIEILDRPGRQLSQK